MHIVTVWSFEKILFQKSFLASEVRIVTGKYSLRLSVVLFTHMIRTQPAENGALPLRNYQIAMLVNMVPSNLCRI